MKTKIRIASGLGAIAAMAGVGDVHAQTTATATSSGSASLVDPFSANKVADLTFGTIVKPNAGTATVSVDASGNRTLSGGAVAVGGGAQAAQFSLVGQGGSTYSVTVPGSFTMTYGTSTLAVSTVNNSGGGGSLSGNSGTYTTAGFGVGGSINLTPATPSGPYTGSFTVTASYN